MKRQQCQRNRQSPIKVCALSGHRPSKMPWGQDENSASGRLFKFRLRESLEYLIGQGYIDFLCGGALGFDQIAAEIILSLRNSYPWVRLIMVCPWPGQADRWTEDQRQRWLNILQASDQVIYLASAYSRSVFLKRNAFMVDHADILLAAYNGCADGGTAMTVNYAHKRGVKVAILRPEPQQRTA